MKRKILLLMLGAFVALTSCREDDLGGNGKDQQADVKISAIVPAQGFETKTVAPMVPDGFKIRYILEVYNEGVLGQHIAQFSPEFNVRLVTSADYDFVMWADYVPDSHSVATINFHYNADDLRAISTIVSSNYEINDQSRDAFYCTESLNIVGSFAVSFTLKRPFGQIRIKTNDLAAINLATQQPDQAGITYTAGISTGFNAMTGATMSPVASYPLVFDEQDMEAAPYSAAGETTAAGWLAFDYIFANKGTNGLIDFSLRLYNSTGDLITTNDKFVNIPIQQNYRTNISGNLLTIGGAIIVILDAGFNNDDFDVNMPELQTLSDFQRALDASTPLINLPIAYLVNDVDINVLNIDGAKLVNVPSILLSLANGLGNNTLTINGGSYDGILKIDAGNSPNATLVINAPNATVEVMGSIGQLNATTAASTLIIGKYAYVGMLNLYGGNAEIFGTVNSFGTVASGCKVYWGATDAASLKAANTHAVPNDGIVLGANISGIDTEVFITKPGYMIDGRGFKLSGPVSNTGQTGQSSTSMINLITGCDDVTIRNVSITNTLGHGINVFESTGVMIEKVSLLNNKKAGLIINGAEVEACNITSSGNAWYFANVAKGSTTTMTPHLKMSGMNNITDAVAIFSEGTNRTGAITPAWKEAGDWVSGGNWVPVQESFIITNLVAVSNYGGHFSFVWALDNGTNAIESDVLWGIDKFLTKGYSLFADKVQTTISPLPGGYGVFYEWQGIKYTPSTSDANSWNAQTSLYVENGLVNTMQSFWVVVDAGPDIIDYIAIGYASNDMPDAAGGPFPAGWSVYHSATNVWTSVGGASTSKGAHALKVSRSGLTTSLYIDGVLVASYADAEPNTQTRPSALQFNAKTYTNTITTTWSYPQVN